MGVIQRAAIAPMNSGLILNDTRLHEVRVTPEAFLPRIPPHIDKQHEQRRLEPDPCQRAVYWRGIDWRKELAQDGRAEALTPLDQGGNDTCVGFAVAHALRANVAIHRNLDVGALNPYFIWAIARERVRGVDRGGQPLPELFLLEALRAVNNYGTPSLELGPRYEDVIRDSYLRRICADALESRSERDREDAALRKVQSIVDLGCFLGDWSAWLHATGPIVAHICIDRPSYGKVSANDPVMRGFEPGRAYDGELSRRYGGHTVVIVGYNAVDHENPNLRDTFTLMNSYGPNWGDGGFFYVPVDDARLSFRIAYGLLLREHLGYDRHGRPRPAAKSRLLDFL